MPDLPEFKIGDKVTLIPVSERSWGNGTEWLDPSAEKVQLGTTYTIRDIDHRAIGRYEHRYPALRFEEIVNPILKGTPEVGDWELAYCIRSFRLVESKTKATIRKKESADA